MDANVSVSESDPLGKLLGIQDERPATVGDIRRIVAYHTIKINKKLDTILEGVQTLSVSVDEGIKQILAAEDQEGSAITVIATSVDGLATQVDAVDTDIKKLLQAIQQGQQVDVTAVLTKIAAHTDAVNTATQRISAATAALKAADDSVNAGEPSNEGEVPK